MAEATTGHVWRSRVRDRMRGQPIPLFVFGDATIPAASVWTGSRLWVEWFRGLGLTAGDRVVIALPPSPAWLMVAVACLWEDLTIVPCLPGSPNHVLDAMVRFDARLALAEQEDPAAAVVAPDRHGRPCQPVAARASRFAPSPQTRLILSTSGTCGRPTHAALSDRNLQAVLDSHAPELGITEQDVCLSVLPWTHAFGLVIDLMTAMFAGATIIRDPAGGREPHTLPALAERWGVTRACLVPLQAEKLSDSEQGRRFLASLRGGVIGGAPVGAALAEFLSTTRLCVGYGQTEASPGIALGRPGAWTERTIGRAVGCETRIDSNAHLLCRGDNVCDAVWREDMGIVPLPAGRWLDTGDLVTERPDGTMAFVGRADHAFKLGNGRLVNAPELEHALAAALAEPGCGWDGARVGVLITTRNHRTIDITMIAPDARTLETLTKSGSAVLRRVAEPVLGSLARHLGDITVRAACDIERDLKGQFVRPSRSHERERSIQQGTSPRFVHAA